MMFLGPSLLGGNTGGVEGYRHVPSTFFELLASIYHNGAEAGRYLSGCVGVWGILTGGIFRESSEGETLDWMEKLLRNRAIILEGLSAVPLTALEEVIGNETETVLSAVA